MQLCPKPSCGAAASCLPSSFLCLCLLQSPPLTGPMDPGGPPRRGIGSQADDQKQNVKHHDSKVMQEEAERFLCYVGGSAGHKYHLAYLEATRPDAWSGSRMTMGQSTELRVTCAHTLRCRTPCRALPGHPSFAR